MDSDLTKNIENSTDELLLLIQQIVDEIISSYIKLYGIYFDYKIRNEIIIHTYNLIIKKYVSDTNFNEKKITIIRTISRTFILKKHFEG